VTDCSPWVMNQGFALSPQFPLFARTLGTEFGSVCRHDDFPVLSIPNSFGGSRNGQRGSVQGEALGSWIFYQAPSFFGCSDQRYSTIRLTSSSVRMFFQEGMYKGGAGLVESASGGILPLRMMLVTSALV
jgi:hypothetical protein